jgi:hypothetical protein
MTYYKWYNTIAWKEFRNSVIELDGFQCVHCERHKSDGAILQVHHKKYISGLKPWEYAREECLTLCKRCHAEQHGLVFPKFGWNYVCDEDLGDLSGECELCGTQLRYQYSVAHENWFDMEVGTVCCDNITGTQIASELKKKHERRIRFINSKRWKEDSQYCAIKIDGVDISIQQNSDKFNIKIKNFVGKKEFESLKECKSHLFDIYNDGSLKRFTKKYIS